MDTSKTITHVGLCAGYGGIELGIKRVIENLRTVALCEIEAFAVANLVSKMEAGLMDPAPVWPDLKTFPWSEFRGRVDILTGGYPCQPFSAAGKRAGKEDPRHLWPWIADGIAAMQPGVCFFENVEGHISLGLSDVVQDLARLGYRTTWGIFSAAECGAPHQRKRVFILAHSRHQPARGWPKPTCPKYANLADGNEDMGNAQSAGMEGPHHNGGASRRLQCHIEQSGHIGEQLADAELHVAARLGQHGWQPTRSQEAIRPDCGSQELWPARPGEAQHGWEPTRVVGNPEGSDAHVAAGGRAGHGGRQAQPALGGDVDGPSGGMDHAELYISCDNRVDELRLLGNGVVPATAALAFRVLTKELYDDR